MLPHGSLIFQGKKTKSKKAQNQEQQKLRNQASQHLGSPHSLVICHSVWFMDRQTVKERLRLSQPLVVETRHCFCSEPWAKFCTVKVSLSQTYIVIFLHFAAVVLNKLLSISKLSLTMMLRGHKQWKLNYHVYSFLLFVSFGP